MELLVFSVLAVAVLAQAESDWFKPPYRYVMGVRQSPVDPRITNGQEARPHQFPHQVALMVNNIVSCGGSIIRADVILTAAHCVHRVSGIVVIAGAHNVQRQEPSQQVIPPSRIIMHERYAPGPLHNDIALIFLSRRINLDGTTARIININRNSCSDNAHAGAIATISGWGRVHTTSASSPVLRFTSNRIIETSVCAKYHRQIKDATVICIEGSGGRGSCPGDSGGPMIVNTGNGIEQVGISSFGGKQCGQGEPSGYARVACYYDWIQARMR